MQRLGGRVTVVVAIQWYRQRKSTHAVVPFVRQTLVGRGESPIHVRRHASQTRVLAFDECGGELVG